MKVFKEVIRKNRPAILLCFFAVAFQLTVFLLYDIMTEPLLYASAVSVLLLAVFLAADYVREKKCHTERLRAASSVARDWKCLPDAHSLAEEDYHKGDAHKDEGASDKNSGDGAGKGNGNGSGKGNANKQN